MNPLRWTREHQTAWFVTSTAGAVLGLLVGFFHLPSFSIRQPWQLFFIWLEFPSAYWPWPLWGFLVTGCVFYAAQLFRRSN